MVQCLTATTSNAIWSLPALNNPKGTAVSQDMLPGKFSGKHVPLYFSAGWCPMCTLFEPSLLLKFIEGAALLGRDEVVYLPLDRSADDASRCAGSMGMTVVSLGVEADAVKTRFEIWVGIESQGWGMGSGHGCWRCAIYSNVASTHYRRDQGLRDTGV
jgi:hypothetical protein